MARVRLRQLEWACMMMCKGLVMEMVDRSADMSERRVCSDWVNTTLVDNCWSMMEYGRVMGEILDAGDDLILRIEIGLRNIREEKEAEVALLLEEEAMARRHEKVERLRLAWSKRMAQKKYERMMTELSKLGGVG
jgi:hypothetical protein